MEAIHLPTQSALGFGADIWILPEPQSSLWTRKMDWYLNGLISKAESRTPLELPLGLKQVLREEEIDVMMVPKHEGLLMVSGDRFLPCQKVIVQQFSGGLKSWLKRVIEQACRSGSGQLRVFLPPGQSFEDAQEAVMDLKSDRTVYFVSELSAC